MIKEMALNLANGASEKTITDGHEIKCGTQREKRGNADLKKIIKKEKKKKDRNSTGGEKKSSRDEKSLATLGTFFKAGEKEMNKNRGWMCGNYYSGNMKSL